MTDETTTPTNAESKTATPTKHAVKGKVKRVVGWATGDREVEAQGEAEELLRRPPTDTDVAQVTSVVKARYGESSDTADDPLRDPETSV